MKNKRKIKYHRQILVRSMMVDALALYYHSHGVNIDKLDDDFPPNDLLGFAVEMRYKLADNIDYEA